jgi:hypothetical protein
MYECPVCLCRHPSSAFVCFGQAAPAPHRATLVQPVPRESYGADERHEAMRLFAPAPNQIPGQLAL